MSGRTVLAYHPLYDGRGFSPVQASWSRYRRAVELFGALGLFRDVERVAPALAAPADLLPVHPLAYVEYVRRRDAEGVGYLDGRDTAAWRGVFDRARAAVGATLHGAHLVGGGSAAHVFNPGGGLHHAHRDRAAGFCIFNDIALAVHLLRETYGLGRVAVVDVDGHHGDGTQELLYADESLKISLHQYDGRFFPGTGSSDEVGWGNGLGYNVNVGLPRRCGDAAYGVAFARVVPAALRAYRPQAIILNCGVDGHFADPLVRLGLTTALYRAVAGSIHALAHELCAGRLLILGSGGYHPEHVARCWAAMLGAVAERLPPLDPGALGAPGAAVWPAPFGVLADGDPPPPDPGAMDAVAGTVETVERCVLPIRLAPTVP